MSIVVRDFVEADRAALRRIFLVARQQAFFWLPAASLAEADFDEVTAGEQILVAQRGASVQGFASMWLPGCFLHSLFVDPASQGQGVGRALLAAATPLLGEEPRLKCIEANTRARRFYERNGWELRERADGPNGPYLLLALPGNAAGGSRRSGRWSGLAGRPADGADTGGYGRIRIARDDRPARSGPQISGGTRDRDHACGVMIRRFAAQFRILRSSRSNCRSRLSRKSAPTSTASSRNF